MLPLKQGASAEVLLEPPAIEAQLRLSAEVRRGVGGVEVSVKALQGHGLRKALAGAVKDTYLEALAGDLGEAQAGALYEA